MVFKILTHLMSIFTNIFHVLRSKFVAFLTFPSGEKSKKLPAQSTFLCLSASVQEFPTLICTCTLLRETFLMQTKLLFDNFF